MCCGCWQNAGSPQVDNERVRDAARCVQRVYEEVSCSGGNLHIVVDDWNVEDEHLAACLPYMVSRELYPEMSDEEAQTEMACYDALMVLTVDERYSALALQEGYWGTENKEK